MGLVNENLRAKSVLIGQCMSIFKQQMGMVGYYLIFDVIRHYCNRVKNSGSIVLGTVQIINKKGPHNLYVRWNAMGDKTEK